MSKEDLIIATYCLVEESYQTSFGEIKLRHRGPAPSLTDVEVLTLSIVGEYLGLGSDKQIWAYFKRHWQSWFPSLGCRTSFTRQSANLLGVMDQLQQVLSEKLCGNTGLFIFDGFPIPVCHIKRYKRSSPFLGIGAVGYCAAKDEKYFGFKGHLLVSHNGVTMRFSIAPANNVAKDLRDDMIADKGLICASLTQTLADQELTLHTPLRKNMDDPRPRGFFNTNHERTS